MLEDLGKEGTILAYHANFEITQIKALARDFPHYETQLMALLPRFVDLRKPFSTRAYYHPDFKGSTSIKSRQHLLDYCKLDTYAMVKLLEVLYDVK